MKTEAKSDAASKQLEPVKSAENTNISQDGNTTKYSTVPNEYSKIHGVLNASNEPDNALYNEMRVAIHHPDENSIQYQGGHNSKISILYPSKS